MRSFTTKFIILTLALFFAIYAAINSIPTQKIIQVPNFQSEKAKLLVESARSQIGVVTKYDGNYFQKDEIPEDSGTCADVIWRALSKANYDLYSKLERDIADNKSIYPSSPALDSNVNFRRVKIIKVFFEKHVRPLTIEVKPGDVENLELWQGGDIVTFDKLKSSGLEHIAIISDKRRIDGVPLIIHNYGEGTQENDYLLSWPAKITGHYRVF